MIQDLKNIKQVETVTSRHLTRQARNCSTNVEIKSAIDHADRHKYVIEWERAKLVFKDTTIWIRKTEPTMNRDEEGATY